VGPEVRPKTGDGPVAPGVRRGIVARRQLFERLAGAGRVAQLSAPAGSGKTILLRSWIRDAGLAESAAWVSVGPGERDPQPLWIAVVDALRHTSAGSRLVRHLTAAPDLDGWAVVERLLEDLASLEERIWLVIDDLHELRSNEALRQLELLLMRSPAMLRFVLASRHDLRLGLHRLRLEGELIEIRAADLRFTPEEAQVLLEAAEVELSDSALALLVQRTEGWAAGLRMAALSRLLAPAEAPDAAQIALDDELRALALINLGMAELTSHRVEEAERHIERGIALAHRIERPYIEILGLAYWATLARRRSFALAVERSMQAVELARRHGWGDEPIVFTAYLALAETTIWQGRLEEGERWLDHAERAVRAVVQPSVRMMLDYARGELEMARGRHEDSLGAFRTAERQAELVVRGHTLTTQLRAAMLQTLLRLGETERVEQALADLDDQERGRGETRTTLAALRLAQDDPQAATIALAPILDGSAPVTNPGWVIQALLLEASARDALGEADATERALERALDLAEPDGALLPFLLHLEPGLLERHSRHRTAHASLVSEILNLLAGARRPAVGEPERLREPLSESETRILRYLPTNLSVPEIANEVYLSVNPVKTHIKHLYAKLDAHHRVQAVERARALGLLAPSGVYEPLTLSSGAALADG
jgi:ATP/maltotriose-dependent transcriptional regulator MalT